MAPILHVLYNHVMEENPDMPVDSLFEDILGPDYWARNSGVSRRSWEILLLRKAMLDDHLWSLAECAERYGISRERVRQLEEDAVAKLIAWKRAEDEKRMAMRRRLLPESRNMQSALAGASARLAEMETPEEMVCCESCAPDDRSRRRTFAELRDELLELLAG